MIRVFRLMVKVIAALLAASAPGLAVTALAGFFFPDLFPPHRYHPRTIYYRRLGVAVHPWLPLDPSREYVIRFWDTRWRIPGEKQEAYQEFLEHLISSFQMKYPNVKVEYDLFRLGEARERLVRAIAEGELPDVFSGPVDPFILYSGWTVPVTPFLRREEESFYETAALEAVSREGEVRAWPRWVETYGWAGNARLLRLAGADLDRIREQGWTYDEFLELAGRLKERSPSTYPLVLDSSGTRSFGLLMQAAGVPSLLSADGQLRWKGEPLVKAAQFLADLREKGGFPPDPASMYRLMLDSFWKEKAAVLGPAGSGFLRHVREHLSRREEKGGPGRQEGAVEPVLLPIPSPPGQSLSPPYTVEAVYAFRRPGGHEDDRVRLVVEFARLVSRGDGAWLAVRLLNFPAYRPDQARWSRELELQSPPGLFRLGSLRHARPAPILPPHLDVLEKALERNVIAPALRQFWAGNLSPGELEGTISAGAREPWPRE